MKYVFVLIFLLFSVATLAQVNTGGPDFDVSVFQAFDIRSSSVLDHRPDEVVPTVFHDLAENDFLILTAEHLKMIVQIHRPVNAANFVDLMWSGQHFISTSLLQSDVYKMWMSSESELTPTWTQAYKVEGIDQQVYNYYEVFDKNVGFIPVMTVNEPHSVELINIFQAAHRAFAENTNQLFYIPFDQGMLEALPAKEAVNP